jgi:L-gulonolactone oxidase
MYRHCPKIKPVDSKPGFLGSLTSWFKNAIIGYYLVEFLFWLSTFVSNLVPLINASYFKLFGLRSKRVDVSYNVFNFDCLFKQYVYEGAIPM